MTYSTLNPKPGLERQVAVGRDMSQLRRRSFFSRNSSDSVQYRGLPWTH